MQIQDSLDKEQKAYNFSNPQLALNLNQNAKNSMRLLYKQQLDNQIYEKTRQRQNQRNRELAEKRQFNQRAISNKQSERLKQQAYKNYYNILMNNQEHLQQSYVSPSYLRDNMKDQHIAHSIQQSQQRQKNWQLQQRKRQMQIKNSYRSQLMSQIQQRKKKQHMDKEQQHRKNQQYRKYGQLPKQITQYERQRQLQQMIKYKQDLDRIRNDKQSRNRSRSQRQNLSGPYYEPMQQHNAIINPLPYNIQNPYILREMLKQHYVPINRVSGTGSVHVNANSSINGNGNGVSVGIGANGNAYQ